MESNKITVAIADDHVQMRSAITGHLKTLGFDILIESNEGADLLDQLNAAVILPQICLLDYNMPGMKGDELAAQISRKYPSIKLVAMTTNVTTSCLLSMLGNGCGSFFTKSSSPTEWKTGIEAIASKGFYFTEWMQKTLLEHIKLNYATYKK